MAAEFIAHYLPQNVAKTLNLDTLTPVDASFVDEVFQEHHSDLLFEVTTNKGSRVSIYILFEHKSYPDKWVLLQLLRYLVNIWQQSVKDGSQQLQPILPIIIYHGESVWPYPTDFLSYFAGDDLYHPFQPRFSALLKDFSAESDEQILGSLHLQSILLALRRIFDRNLAAEFEAFIGTIFKIRESEQGLHLIGLIVYYFGYATQKIEVNEMKRVLKYHEGWGEPVVGSLAHHYKMLGLEEGRQEGRQKGREEGREEGREQGITQSIIDILTSKFNELPSTLHTQIQQINSLDILRQATVQAASADTIDTFVTWLNNQKQD